MRMLVTMVMAFMLVAGCSDDDNDNTGSTDGAIADTGTMSDGETVMDTAPTTDGGTTTDSVVEDSSAVEDGSQADALNISAVCATIITHCSEAEFAQWFDPFTESNCETIFQCVSDLYTGECTIKFIDFLACISTVSSVADCDTTCAALQADMTTSCECPASCGVNCGP